MASTAPVPDPPRMSLEEWAAMEEDEPGELVDGVLEEEEAPSYVHEYIVMWLGRVVGAWAITRGAIIGGSGAKLAVRANRGRMPDATIYLPGAKRPPASGLVRVPPSVAIEIVTPTPRDARSDRVVKLVEYAQFGVAWYWIIDPELRTFEILELTAERRYTHVVSVVDGVIDPVPGCDGLVLDVSALWAEIDALADEADDSDPGDPKE